MAKILILTVLVFASISLNSFLIEAFLATSPTSQSCSISFQLYSKPPDWDDDDEDDDDVAIKDKDWRAFRAKLVMGEKKSESTTESKTAESTQPIIDEGDLDGIGSLFEEDFVSEDASSVASNLDLSDGMTPLDPSQFAYDSGDMIEQGSVILGGVEQDFGFGLRQQYFHKCVVLVVDHEESTFTKGIILNRPTDMVLDDEINPGKKWRVWFGGDVQGLDAKKPDIVCLHSLKNPKAVSASIPVMNDIQWTSFDNAKRLVQAGVANVRDFWVFVGYAGWGPGQLKGELERNSWYMVATDSQTLLKELARQGEGAEPRDAGLDTWGLLMNMIGRGETTKEKSGGFDDLMLKEWAYKHLLSSVSGGGGGEQQRNPDDFKSDRELVDNVMRVLGATKDSKAGYEGALLRASPTERSPFLLKNQEFHKSIILILVDDETASIGVVLNRPSTKGLDIKVSDKNTGSERVVRIPMRYGGQYAVKGQENLLWLHSSPRLKTLEIGTPIGEAEDAIWKCTAQDVMAAIGQGDAKAEDFVVVSGVSVWVKDFHTQGIEGELNSGTFKKIPKSARKNVWNSLLMQQDVMTEHNFHDTISLSKDAWSHADATRKGDSESKTSDQLPIGGLGEGFDEEDDSFVYKSNVKVAKLADDALKSWCATFLLGKPKLGEE
mmetsp:Transcript_45677/g.110671  ORF Transcript_45677/g.110671 Transcript_45677/m.110671 type:complete len:663 (+) Transcript_45677:155-2143(+)|eukprot:CAMPEP_0113619330 /NCGR_PEP_ID=MMETSP0017_2-20120614/9813_1 /TAXON_ID=2856 /ORGANISM="Cylindrotheca closterium" /LENGTH=662 /DNA_ID=CAMNT_0000528899 /DNA_START=78 /DNA_END=2066 /DNA_ORIENTATION=+ /assembly_acc=CAM_ASM_000147